MGEKEEGEISHIIFAMQIGCIQERTEKPGSLWSCSRRLTLSWFGWPVNADLEAEKRLHEKNGARLVELSREDTWMPPQGSRDQQLSIWSCFHFCFCPFYIYRHRCYMAFAVFLQFFTINFFFIAPNPTHSNGPQGGNQVAFWIRRLD